MWKYYFALVVALWLFFNTFFRSPWQVWRRGVPVAAALPSFFVRVSGRVMAVVKTDENSAVFDKIESLQNRFLDRL